MIHIDPRDHGWVQESEIPNAERMYDMLQGVIESLYETGDLQSLEHCLEEACAEVNLRLPSTELKVKEKSNIESIHYHLGYQRGLIDNMNKV